MKRIFTLFAASLSLSAAIAQNVGVGTTTPGAKLTVNGAVASTPQSGPAGATITIPANVTIYTITDDGASAANAATATGPVDGQFLTIYNTDAQAVTFAGQTIAASGGVMSFQYISSGWRLVSDNQSGGNNFIKNQTATPQSGAGFNTSGNGTIGGTLSVTGTSTLGALIQTGTTSINTTGSAGTSVGVGGTGTVNLGNSTGGVNVKPLTTAGVVTNTAAGTLGTLPGTTSTVLHGNAAGAPSFGQVALGSEVSGILPVANGGTGSSAQNWVDLTTNQTAAGNKTWSGNASFGSTVTVSPFTSAGVVHNNASGLLSSSAVSLTSDVSGILPLANGGTGSNLSATGGTGQYLKQTSAGGVVSVGTIPASDLSAGINGTTNTIPKFTGANTIGNSSVTDNGTTVSTSEPLASGAHTVNAGGTQAALVVNGTSNPEIVMQNSGTTKLEIGIAGGASAYITNAALNDATIRQTGGQKILFSTSSSGSTNDLTLSGGNAGIGSTAPVGRLSVITTNSDGNVAAWGTGQATVGGDGTTAGALGFSYSTTNNAAYISALSPSVAWRDLGMRFSNAYFYYNGASEAMRINNSGNVSIGGVAPTAQLHTTGTVRFANYTSGFLTTDASGNVNATRSIAVSGTGIAVTNGNAVSGNPTLNLNYGSAVSTAANGQYPVGNFGQFENHGTYTDFNTTPNYWGWNYVQGNTNGPSTASAQWYREIVGLGANYPARGAGSYSLELAYPRFSNASAGVWMRINEGNSYQSWNRIDALGISAVSSSMHPSMDDISSWTTVLGSCVDDGAYTVNWGFPITIDGTSYTSGWISTNGVLGFGSSSSTAYSNTSLPSSISTDPMLFFHWDDDGSDLIRYWVQGTSPNRNCFIQWQGSESTACGGGSSRVMAYITLHEGSSVVSVRYLNQGSNTDAQGGSATFGFQYAGGSSARTVPMGYNTRLLDDNATNQHFSIDLQ